MNDESLIDELQKLYAITSTTGSMGWDPSTSTITAGTGAVGFNGSYISNTNPVSTKEYVIKGEMLMASHTYNQDAIDTIGKDEVRRNLALQLASEMLASKHIEFTQMRDRISGETIVKARVFVVPDGQTKILRTNGY